MGLLQAARLAWHLQAQDAHACTHTLQSRQGMVRSWGDGLEDWACHGSAWVRRKAHRACVHALKGCDYSIWLILVSAFMLPGDWCGACMASIARCKAACWHVPAPHDTGVACAAQNRELGAWQATTHCRAIIATGSNSWALQLQGRMLGSSTICFMLRLHTHVHACSHTHTEPWTLLKSTPRERSTHMHGPHHHPRQKGVVHVGCGACSCLSSH